MENSDLTSIIKNTLWETSRIHDGLGTGGEKLVRKNQFGETAVLMDLEAEKTVLESLKEKRIPIRVISEEHGLIDFSDNPKYFGILDGLDGSNRYIAGRGKERYGTMFAVFSSLAPRYLDYLVCGIMEHTTKRLFVSEKGKGAQVIESDLRTNVCVSNNQIFDKQTRVYIDLHYQINRDMFSNKLQGYNVSDPRSFAVYFNDLVLGNVDIVLAATRKGNLELAIGFGLVKEAGGIICTLEGEQIDDKDYLSFAQDKEIQIIIAANQRIADQFIKHINH